MLVLVSVQTTFFVFCGTFSELKWHEGHVVEGRAGGLHLATNFPFTCFLHSSSSLGSVSVAWIYTTWRKNLDQMSFKLQQSLTYVWWKINSKSSRENELMWFWQREGSLSWCINTALYFTLHVRLPVLSEITLSVHLLSTHAKQMDWQWRPQRAKNPSMDFRLLLPPPLPPAPPPPAAPCRPHFHFLLLPNRFSAGTLLTQVKGLWSSSQCLCLQSWGRDGGTEGRREGDTYHGGQASVFVRLNEPLCIPKCTFTPCKLWASDRAPVCVSAIFIRVGNTAHGRGLGLQRGRHRLSGCMEPLVCLLEGGRLGGFSGCRLQGETGPGGLQW